MIHDELQDQEGTRALVDTLESFNGSYGLVWSPNVPHKQRQVWKCCTERRNLGDVWPLERMKCLCSHIFILQ